MFVSSANYRGNVIYMIRIYSYLPSEPLFVMSQKSGRSAFMDVINCIHVYGVTKIELG